MLARAFEPVDPRELHGSRNMKKRLETKGALWSGFSIQKNKAPLQTNCCVRVYKPVGYKTVLDGCWRQVASR